MIRAENGMVQWTDSQTMSGGDSPISIDRYYPIVKEPSHQSVLLFVRPHKINCALKAASSTQSVFLIPRALNIGFSQTRNNMDWYYHRGEEPTRKCVEQSISIDIILRERSQPCSVCACVRAKLRVEGYHINSVSIFDPWGVGHRVLTEKEQYR